MKYWICLKCGLIHADSTVNCECGNLLLANILLNGKWLEFPSKKELEAWVDLMRKRAGATMKLGKDLTS